MTNRLPVEVNPYRLIEQRRELSGQLEIKRFSRLDDLLSDKEGSVNVELSFKGNEVNLPIIRGSVTGELQLVCQRCMKPYALPLDCNIDVVLVKTDQEAERLQDSYDTWMVEESRIFLQDFVEDEILLGIPQLVMHEDCEPYRPLTEALPEDSSAPEPEKNNPFSVLQQFKNPDE